MDTSNQKFLKIALRATIGIGLALFLVHKTLEGGNVNLQDAFRSLSKGFLALTVFTFIGATFLTAVRWNLLLKMQGIRLGLLAVLRLVMIGFFFNLVIPGAVGGDVVKMAYIARQTPGKRTEAISTIVLDRLLGVMALFILAGFMVLGNLKFIMAIENPVLKWGATLVGFGSFGGVLGILGIELRSFFMKFGFISSTVSFFAEKLPVSVTETVKRIINVLEVCRKNRLKVVQAMGIALVVHLTLVCTLFFAGKAAAENRLAFSDYLLVNQVANAISSIPVSPAGIGVRDKVIADFLEIMGAVPDKAAIIPLCITFSILINGFLGAIVYILLPANTSATSLSSEEKRHA